MGLFNKQKIHPAVKNIYQKIGPDIKDKLFYGDLTRMNEVLVGMTCNVFGNPSNINVDTCFQIYLRVYNGSRGGFSTKFSTPEYITESLCKMFSYLYPQVVTNCVNASLEYIYMNEPQLLQEVQAYRMFQQQLAENAAKNAHLFNLYIRDEDYGLVPYKPVFVEGFEGADIYFSRLFNLQGVAPVIKRLGSMEVNGISGPVDLYLLTFSESDQRQIFVSIYSFENSSVAPEGLTLLIVD